MVEVTINNFENVINEFHYEIKNCKFYALDCEFSFLPLDGEFIKSYFDYGEERYEGLKRELAGSTVLQIGITPFNFNRDLNEYSAHPYKFYICPRYFSSHNEKVVFKASTIEFLHKNSFKIEKCFYEGISYLNKSSMKILRNELYNDQLFFNLENEVSRNFMDNLILVEEKVRKWLLNSDVGDVVSFTLPEPKNDRYLYQLQERVRRKYSQVWTAFTDDFSQISVSHISVEERTAFMKHEKKPEVKEEFLKKLSGFSRVFNILVESQKPLVGHNLFVDLLMIYKQFYDVLPGNLKKFKTSVNTLFPIIYDTKIMSYDMNRILKKKVVQPAFEDNSLGSLYEYFKTKNSFITPPTIVADTGDAYNKDEDQKLHDAGWDSYITGFVFLKLANLFALSQGKNQDRNMTSMELLTLIKGFKNRVHIARARIPYLNFEGKDPESTRPPILHLCSNDHKLIFTRDVLDEMFSDHGPIQYKITSSNTALLAVSNYTTLTSLLLDVRNKKCLNIEKYSIVRHSKAFKGCLIVGIIIPTAVILWLGVKS